jgi:hypothetical protein
MSTKSVLELANPQRAPAVFHLNPPLKVLREQSLAEVASVPRFYDGHID